MASMSIRLNDRDDALIRKYAELNNMDLSSFIRQTVIERIEGEYDLTLFDKVWADEQNQPKVSHDDLKEELGL